MRKNKVFEVVIIENNDKISNGIGQNENKMSQGQKDASNGVADLQHVEPDLELFKELVNSINETPPPTKRTNNNNNNEALFGPIYPNIQNL